MAGKKNIALFMCLLENDYSYAIMKGALEGARECDTNLIVFPVDIMNAPYLDQDVTAYRYQYNAFCDYMNNSSIDGIIVEYGTLAAFISAEKKRELLRKIGNKPAVLIAERAEGYSSICIDNANGFIELIDHVVKDHGCTKIGYLSGPKENSDANIRLQTVIDRLKFHNIDLEESYIEYGNFSEYIETEVNNLLDRHPDIEALICANDSMALGASRVLKERGIEPGRDICLTGYDNSANSFLHEPAITTVKADPIELSRVAVHELCKEVFDVKELTLKTSMVKRESCGCCGFEVSEDWKKVLGISSDWREMARFQRDENNTRLGLERELGSIGRVLVFNIETDKERYQAILSMLRRLRYESVALFLYDEFIDNDREDIWKNPDYVNLVGFYSNIAEPEDHVFDKGELIVPIDEIFNWGIVRDGKRHEILVLPLFFGQKQLGFVAVESDTKRFIYAYDIAGQISNILYTIQMLEEQQRMKIALENANEAKSHFLANMSHEIRTPINAIIGFNEMILRENKDVNIADYANDVKNAADALLLLVNDTLDFSKIEAGKMELIPAEYKLLELINGAVIMMTSRAENKGLALYLEYDENLPSVLEGDSGRINQILINLISNAVKYTEKGKVILNVSGSETQDGVSLRFKVTDTGIGIKEKDMGRLFNVFERIDEKRNRNIEGTGLGLNITVGLLKLMDSTLEVKSEYGVGSEFSFEIKQKIIDRTPISKAKALNDSSKSKSNAPGFLAPDAKILVVDDNFLNRKVIRSLLKETKITIDQADSGAKCIEMVKENTYDIIFLDHMMPEMDGIETLDRMKEEKLIDLEKIPVIALTANAVAGAKEDYIDRGFTDYLAKPVLPPSLYDMIIKYMPKEKIEEKI